MKRYTVTLIKRMEVVVDAKSEKEAEKKALSEAAGCVGGWAIDPNIEVESVYPIEGN